MLLPYSNSTSGGPSSNSVEFYRPRSPHTCQLYFACLATLAYAVAVPGLLGCHNPLAAGGWGVACAFALAWALLLWQENRWRRLENLEVANPSEGYQSSLSRKMIRSSHTSGPAAFPLYISQGALVCAILAAIGLLAFALYLYALAAQRHERLNGPSHWLSAIAFTGGAKSASQLAWRIHKIRRTWRSVTTYLAEAYSPLP